ncbi:MAG: hypothetical protein ACFFDN_19515, partial [Candidatus Hodarchaeota archaeon]
MVEWFLLGLTILILADIFGLIIIYRIMNAKNLDLCKILYYVRKAKAHSNCPIAIDYLKKVPDKLREAMINMPENTEAYLLFEQLKRMFPDENEDILKLFSALWIGFTNLKNLALESSPLLMLNDIFGREEFEEELLEG